MLPYILRLIAAPRFIAAGLILSAGTALAGAPAPVNRVLDLAHVCARGPLKGATCDPTEPAPCGRKNNHRPHRCVVDFAKFTLKGSITLIADEAPADNDGPSGAGPTITAILEIKKSGETFFVAKTFQAQDAADWPQIGGWRGKANLTAESDIDAVLDTFLWQNPSEESAVCEPAEPGTCANVLGELGTALNEIAGYVFCGDFSNAIPVWVDFKQHRKDARAFDGGDYPMADTAEVLRGDFEIRFVGAR